MRITLLILLFAAMAGVVYVLVRGVIAMASGKDVTGEQSQMWMRRRVLFQAVAIVIVILILVLASASSATISGLPNLKPKLRLSWKRSAPRSNRSF